MGRYLLRGFRCICGLEKRANGQASKDEKEENNMLAFLITRANIHTQYIYSVDMNFKIMLQTDILQ